MLPSSMTQGFGDDMFKILFAFLPIASLKFNAVSTDAFQMLCVPPESKALK